MTGLLGEVESDTENSSSSMPSCTDGQFYIPYPWALKEFHPTHITAAMFKDKDKTSSQRRSREGRGWRGSCVFPSSPHTLASASTCSFFSPAPPPAHFIL